MTAIDTLITNLQQYRYSAGSGPVIADVDLFVAALQEIQSALSGSLTITDLHVTGTAQFDGDVTMNDGIGVFTIGNGVSFQGEMDVHGDINSIGVLGTSTMFGISGFITGASIVMQSVQPLTNGAGASAGTITNAPHAGNPDKWVEVNDAGTIRKIPTWI